MWITYTKIIYSFGDTSGDAFEHLTDQIERYRRLGWHVEGDCRCIKESDQYVAYIRIDKSEKVSPTQSSKYFDFSQGDGDK